MIEINYKASYTASKFHASDRIVRGFLGPVGNGKSVACINEGLRLSLDQWPNSQGIRKSRGVIVRNTGPELRTTVLNTWKQWVPEVVAPLRYHPIISCMMKQPMPDGTTVEMEVYFLALDNDKDVKKLLSLEATWIFLNEAKELPYSVVKAARERIGRYPSAIDGYQDTDTYKAPRDSEGNLQPCKRKALIMDTNPTDDTHWWYQLAEIGYLKGAKDKVQAKEDTESIFEFFHGPSPLIKTSTSYKPNPDAENIANLPGGYQYYLDMIAGNTEDHINVMVMGNYGVVVDGRPVYPQYNDRIHCPEDYVRPIRGLGIRLGWDFGLTPSLILGQLTDRGQARVIAELVSEDMDVRSFARDVVKPFLNRNFKDFEVISSIGDPAGNARGEGEGKTAIGILNDMYDTDDPLNMGFHTSGASTNDPTLRIDGVNRYLIRLVDGEPAYLLSKSCVMLRKGKLGGYHYKRVAVAGAEGLYKEKPEKDQYSHPADAEQYLFSDFEGITVDSEEETEYTVRDNPPLGWS